MTAQPTDRGRLVTWYECDCPWVTKFCEEDHLRQAVVPDAVLRAFAEGADPLAAEREAALRPVRELAAELEAKQRDVGNVHFLQAGLAAQRLRAAIQDQPR